MPEASPEEALQWASRVALALSEIANKSSTPALRELWIAEDLAIHVRYLIREQRLAARFGALDIEPASGLAAGDPYRMASDLYHDLHTDPGPDAWKDSQGFEWWGDEPSDGWPAVDTRRRVFDTPQRTDRGPS